MWVLVIRTAKTVLLVLAGAVMFAVQNPPDAVRPNAAQWLSELGLRDLPAWLESPATDQWVFYVALAVLMATIAWVVVPWLFERKRGLAPRRLGSGRFMPLADVAGRLNRLTYGRERYADPFIPVLEIMSGKDRVENFERRLVHRAEDGDVQLWSTRSSVTPSQVSPNRVKELHDRGVPLFMRKADFYKEMLRTWRRILRRKWTGKW